MAKNIKLGDICRDRITGFSGVVYGLHQYLTGCNKVSLAPQELDVQTGKPKETQWFDEQQLEVIGHAAGLVDEPEDTKPVGGPSEQPRRSL